MFRDATGGCNLLTAGSGFVIRQIYFPLGAVGGTSHLGGAHLQLGDGGSHLIGLALLILHPGYCPFAYLGGAARLLHQMTGAGIDLGEQLAGLAGQHVDGAGQGAEFATAAVIDAAGHVPGRHVIQLLVDHLQRALNAARRGIADDEGGGSRDGGHDQDPEAGTADRIIRRGTALAGDGAGRLSHLVEQPQAVDQAGVELLIEDLQRSGQLLGIAHGGEQPLRAERQLLHPVEVGDKALLHIIRHQHPVKPLARHLDVLAQHLLQFVEVGLGIGPANVLQVARDARGNELRLVAHGALAGRLLQQQIGRPLVGVLQPDEGNLQLVALILGIDPLAVLGEHLFGQAVELFGGGIDLLEAGIGLGHSAELVHLLAQLTETRLLLLELTGQLR